MALKAVEQGAQIVRVHDVPETVQGLKVWRGLRDAALTPRTASKYRLGMESAGMGDRLDVPPARRRGDAAYA